MCRTIKPEQFEKAVLDALAKYGDGVSEIMDAETKSISRQTASELKRTAPTGGDYAKGWSHKKGSKGGRGAVVAGQIVYNRHYQLTHLLESPHSTGRYRGGHYPKKADYTGNIAKVEEEYTNKFVQEVLAKL